MSGALKRGSNCCCKMQGGHVAAALSSSCRRSKRGSASRRHLPHLAGPSRWPLSRSHSLLYMCCGVGSCRQLSDTNCVPAARAAPRAAASTSLMQAVLPVPGTPHTYSTPPSVRCWCVCVCACVCPCVCWASGLQQTGQLASIGWLQPAEASRSRCEKPSCHPPPRIALSIKAASCTVSALLPVGSMQAGAQATGPCTHLPESPCQQKQ